MTGQVGHRRGVLLGEGRELSSGLVRVMAVVVAGVGAEDVPGVGLVPNQQVIERFASHGSDDPVMTAKGGRLATQQTPPREASDGRWSRRTVGRLGTAVVLASTNDGATWSTYYEPA